MSSKKVTKPVRQKKEKSFKIPPPISFLQNLLGDKPVSRDDLKAAMTKKGYAAGTINAQLFQLRHWPGAILETDGFIKNPKFVAEPPKQKKTVKTEKATPTTATAKPAPKPSRPAKSRSFHPVPKPSARATA